MKKENLTETVVIPEGTRRIAPYEFDLYVKLHEITIPDSVKVIGKYAFSHCHELKEIHIPPYVKNFYEGIFFNCHALEILHIPNFVKYIGKMAFANCEALRELTIPDSVTRFGQDAFFGCENLHALHYMGVTIQPNIFCTPWVRVEKMLEIIQTADFSISVSLPAKYHTAGKMYLAGIAPEQTKKYIKSKFPTVFRGLIDLNDVEVIEKIVASGEFVSRRNIDKYIDYAIQKGKNEISLILMNYKNENIGYRSMEDLFRL